MERLCRKVVFLVLFFCLDLGSCHGTQGEAEGRSVARDRAMQTIRTRKLLQIPYRYRGAQSGNKAGWGRPTFRPFPLPAPPALSTGWRKEDHFYRTGTAPPLFRAHPPPTPPPIIPQPLMARLSPPPPTSPPPPQDSHLPPAPRRPAAAGAVPEAKQGSSTAWPISASVTVAASLLLAASAALFITYCRRSRVVTVRPWATGLSGQLQKAFVTGVPALKRSELEVACEDFSNIIGSLPDYTVYKGTLSSGVEIAVVSTTRKSASDWSKRCESQFRKKIASLSRVNHKNFVNLLGFCEEEQPFTRMMVFEYAPNGTLFEHLHVKEDEHLDWPTRLRVAMGIAYCLEHMHQLSSPEILRTLDTSTVFLTDDFAAKVSDVFFCDEPREAEATSPAPPLSDKESVVYSYGMILLEIMSGRPPVSEAGTLDSWAACCLRGQRQLRDVMDPALAAFDVEAVDKLGNVVRSCADGDPRRRPTMAEVACQLREITAVAPDAATPRVSPLWWAELEIGSAEAPN